MVSKFTPICLFTYNRVEAVRLTVDSLKANYHSRESDLYIFSDGPKSDLAYDEVQKVREYLKTIEGFRKVEIIESDVNKGLAKSIIEGVTKVISEYGRVIVVEDDLITSPNFLSYMNQALDFYFDYRSQIWSISGFSFPIKYDANYLFDNSFGVRASSWGWATWEDRWEKVDWNVSDYITFKKDRSARRLFSRGGSDMCHMLDKQMSGKINSWAIRFCYAQFKHQMYDVLPVKSKVINIGFNADATNTFGMESRFSSNLDQSGNFNFIFNSDVAINASVLNQFRKPLSFIVRIKYKILSLFERWRRFYVR